MEKYSQLKKLEYIIVSCLVAFAVIVVISIYSFISLGKARRANAKYDEFIATLEQKEANLKDANDYMNSEAYLEEQARNHLGMIKDGETLYVFK